MLVIGTAGHIDHGKSAIVKRLTGTDPDRLPEEKQRGMTIDLGFAFYNTPGNDTIAFIDVPGHERFVKNMVAGVGTIDAVMLVIAADDGWMPQSEEHFQIVRLLNVRQGMIIINKIDLVEEDWLNLLEQDIKEKVIGTFLENTPVFKLSAQTGDGFEQLGDYLNRLTTKLQAQRDIEKPRMYIDRSFVRPGIGGVVTGTLRGGKLSTGQTVSVWPSLQNGKIRSINSNNQQVKTAVPGQRTAITFTGLDKELLFRGGVITDFQPLSFFKENPVLALSIELVSNISFPLDNRRRVLLIVGTSETEGEVRLYYEKDIKPGQRGIIFFKPDNPLFALAGDYFILRLPTPMLTLGGGQILDHLKQLPRQRNIDRYDYLKIRRQMTLKNLIISELKKQSIIPIEQLLNASNFSREDIESQVKSLWHSKVVSLFEGCVFHNLYFDEVLKQFKDAFKSFLEDNSHLKGLSLEQISKVNGNDSDLNLLIVKYLITIGEIIKLKDKYNFTGRGMVLKGAIKTAYENILSTLQENPFAPPTLTKLAAGGKINKDAIRFILETEQGYKCGSEFIFLIDSWEKIVRFIKEVISNKGELSVSDLKDKFGFSRKYAIPVLEETDRIKLTKRDDNRRIKGDCFENQEFNL
ncbi:MAG: selenocysteine-specific translation elongation factor [Candidatus Zixiibacteriota bacterium]